MFPCPDASNYMQHDLVRSPFDPDLMSKNEVDLSMSPYIYFDLSRQEKHDCTYIITVHIKMKKVIRGERFR